MRFSINFIRAFFVLLRHLFPIWGGIAILISLMGIVIAQLETASQFKSLNSQSWKTHNGELPEEESASQRARKKDKEINMDIPIDAKVSCYDGDTGKSS